MTGKLMDERLGRWNFWTMFVGFNVAFLPMHLTGLMGMPRRVYTYNADMGFTTLNLITSIGSYVFAAGVGMFFWNVSKSWRHGETAGADPWGGPTLEWSVPSPPPSYNFAVIPTVATRDPLWEDQLREGAFCSSLDEGMTLENGKEALGVSILDGEPRVILKMPEDTLAPFLLALATTFLFVGLLMQWWWFVTLAAFGVIGALLAWTWPRRRLLERADAPAGEGA
jgi:hypothetical protein